MRGQSKNDRQRRKEKNETLGNISFQNLWGELIVFKTKVG